MTKKHFKAVAEIIRARRLVLYSHLPHEKCWKIVDYELDCLARMLGDSFKTFNKTFDKEKFLIACGLGKENIEEAS